jgi:hypothetical protein
MPSPRPTVHASRHRAPRQWLGSGMPLGCIGSTTAFGAVGFTGQERREARTVSQSRTRAISDLAVRWFRPPELWSPTKKPPSVGCGPAHVLRIGGAALAGIKHRASPARGCRSGRAPVQLEWCENAERFDRETEWIGRFPNLLDDRKHSGWINLVPRGRRPPKIPEILQYMRSMPLQRGRPPRHPL